MAGITLRTARQVVPMIYAYTTPEIARHNGWTKIGYTEQSVDKRLKQQTHTADVLFHEEWRGNAVYDDGSGEVFTDHDFHAYLRKLNVENDRKNEWFHLDGQQSRRYFQDFRMNRGRVQLDAAIAYTLREEQARAVRDTKTYYQSHPGGEYLWNAKPRFGKTLSVYDFCKQVDAQTVLIVTNRPAIANSWYSDYVRFLGRESGYLFVSHVDALAGQPHVLDEQGYLDAAAQGEELYKRIEFVSLQDMKGSKYFGGEYDKLRHLTELNWDVLVIDEAHEGVDTYKTDLAFDRIRRKFTLHLSGTPFKALANDKFAGPVRHALQGAGKRQVCRRCHLQLDLCGRAGRQAELAGRTGATEPLRKPSHAQPLHLPDVRDHPGRDPAGRGDRRRNAGICL